MGSQISWVENVYSELLFSRDIAVSWELDLFMQDVALVRLPLSGCKLGDDVDANDVDLTGQKKKALFFLPPGPHDAMPRGPRNKLFYSGSAVQLVTFRDDAGETNAAGGLHDYFLLSFSSASPEVNG
ncbi:hypothetical protein PAAG_05975 [Paracoccidioides lutzii Pb01]|uniref:Uncharacterized protein n=1 Tax=Paracoccidioides lutzii (strain ATCC MYA-826 / Pb01) TaxID=502779 RepID=C1H5D4_PARBA|nr:hypothetical protein PAAG_05975 [Paracoccidioides lutzii Pb01]EEH34928.1 hypothetical protein PAAG_05975 [Paracoccidioides lutzii Pb01]